jgi:hypothetical protein
MKCKESSIFKINRTTRFKTAFVYVPVLTWLFFMLSNLVVLQSYGETNNQNRDLEIMMTLIQMEEADKQELRAYAANDSNATNKLLDYTIQLVQTDLTLINNPKFIALKKDCEQFTGHNITLGIKATIDEYQIKLDEVEVKGVKPKPNTLERVLKKIADAIHRLFYKAQELQEGDRVIFFEYNISSIKGNKDAKIGDMSYKILFSQVYGQNIRTTDFVNLTEATFAAASNLCNKNINPQTVYKSQDDLKAVMEVGIDAAWKYLKDKYPTDEYKKAEEDKEASAYLELLESLNGQFSDAKSITTQAFVGTLVPLSKVVEITTKSGKAVFHEVEGASEVLEKLSKNKTLQAKIIELSKNNSKVINLIKNVGKLAVWNTAGIVLLVITPVDNGSKSYMASFTTIKERYDELNNKRNKGTQLSNDELKELNDLEKIVEQNELNSLEALERSNSLTDQQKERLKFLRCKYKGIGCDDNRTGNLLTAEGKFIDNLLETDYKKYLARKSAQSKTPRERLDWKEARDYLLLDSPIARGNSFNLKAQENSWYNFFEINLENGKRLDSYVPPSNGSFGEIISRKATNLDEIELSTFENYLKEMQTKYSSGTKIRSDKYPALDGQNLQGKQILEIPSSNQSFSQINDYINLAKNKYNIEIRFRPE